MAMPQELAAPLFQQVDVAATAFYTNAAVVVATGLRTPFQLFLTLYVILWGLAHWRGLIQEPIADFVTRTMKIGLIGVFALNAPYYMSALGTWLYATPERLLGMVFLSIPDQFRGAGVSAPAAMDLVLQNIGAASDRFYLASAATSAWDFGSRLYLQLTGELVFLFGVAFFSLGMALLLLAKVLMAIMLAIGPIFIALLLFEPTRGFFSSWLGQTLTGFFTYFIAGVTTILGTSIVQMHLEQALNASAVGAVPSLSQFAGFFFVAIAIVVVLIQVPAIAAALGNGVQVTTLGAVGSGYRMAYGGLRRMRAPGGTTLPAHVSWRRNRIIRQ